MNKKYFLICALAISLSLNSFGQKCTKFIDYQNKIINLRGVQIPGIPANLAPLNISKLQRPASERLEIIDVLQYNLCQKMNSIKIPVLKETMQMEYSNFLMEMMQMIVAETNNAGVAPQSATTTTQPTIPQPTTSDQSVTPVIPEPVTPQPAPQPVTPPASGKIRVTFPCQVIDPFGSADGVIRAFGMEESADAQIARSIANTVALAELASKIEITVKSTIDYHVLRTQKGATEEFEKHYEMRTNQSVNQTMRGYKTVCEEYVQDQGTGKYTCYVVLEINIDNMLAPVYNDLVKDAEIKKAVPNYEEFKETFKRVERVRKDNSLYTGI